MDFSTLTFSEVAAGAGLVGTIALALLQSRFVAKADYKEDTLERNAWREKTEDRMNELETSSALAKQPIEEMNNTLKRIEGSLLHFVESHQDLERRTLVLEIENRKKTN